jgi:transposase
MPRTSTVHAVTTIGIDMGKNTLHMIGLDTRGAIVLREKVSRGRIASRLANLPSCLIGIEAGLATHYVARELAALGHDVKQVPPTYAKPFRQGHKNDFRDAHSVAEAVQRPTTRFVPVKTDEQLDLQALHRVRSRLVSERTAVVNQIRGFLLERGIIVRQGLRFLRQALPDILAKRTDILSPRMVRIVADLASDWRWLDERIEPVTDEIETLAKSDDGCRRVMTVPGIGPIISSAMVAAIGNGAAFARGRDFSAWIGLVPKQMSTGDRTILGRITKRGNGYLRTLFVQAARVILLRPASWPKHGFGVWLARAAQRLHRNVLAAALANKLARIAWTVLAQERSYEARVTKALLFDFVTGFFTLACNSLPAASRYPQYSQVGLASGIVSPRRQSFILKISGSIQSVSPLCGMTFTSNSSLQSILRQRERLASQCRRPCWLAPTR